MNKLGRNFTREVAIQKGLKVQYGRKRGTKGNNGFFVEPKVNDRVLRFVPVMQRQKFMACITVISLQR